MNEIHFWGELTPFYGNNEGILTSENLVAQDLCTGVTLLRGILEAGWLDLSFFIPICCVWIFCKGWWKFSAVMCST